MTVLNYKSSGSWLAIPTSALAGTGLGTLHVAYPLAEDVTGAGNPCGAYGLPEIIIETPVMSASGMAFWHSQFSSVSVQYADLSIEAYDPRSGSITKWAGKLHWPRFNAINYGGVVTFNDVSIKVSECASTT